MADVNGFFNRTTIRDTRGTTNNSVGGFGNTVDFRGDKGRNTFDIGGQQNNVQVHNLGKDDRVNLEGPGWQQLADANSRDGIVRYHNSITGSFAEIHTDGGRNDNFVKNRVNGANNSCNCGCWNNIGNAASYASGWAQGYAAGQSNGFQRGYDQANYNFGFNVGSWLSRQFLGPLAWGL